MPKELPARKHSRLNGYDYSSNGAYFITFCVENGHEMLGEIVGRGILDAPHIVELSEYGINLRNTIDFINKNFENIMIDKYVIMPNHVHMIVLIDKDGGLERGDSGASEKPRPTEALIPKLRSSMKRYTNKLAGFNMWQDSYHDHIIRDDADYQHIWQYIDKNPAKWAEDRYYNIGSDNQDSKQAPLPTKRTHR